MKKRSLLAVFAAMALAIGTFCFVGCDGTSDNGGNSNNGGTSVSAPTDNSASSGEETKVTTTYQFTGAYDELKTMFSAYDIMMNLNSDGKGVVYICGKDEAIDTVKISSWKEETVDGEKVLIVKDGENPDGAYEVHTKSDGTFIVRDYYFAGAGGVFHRTVDLTQLSEVTYNDEAAFVAYAKERRAQPTVLTTLKSGESSTLKFLDDNTALFSMYGQAEKKYTWAIDENRTLTLQGAEEGCLPVEVTGESLEAITIKFVMQYDGNDVSVVFTGDVNVIAPAQQQQPQA